MANDPSSPAAQVPDLNLAFLRKPETDEQWLARAASGAQSVLDYYERKGDEDRTDFEQFAKDLERAIKRHGVWNVLAAMPDTLRDIVLGFQEEDAERDRDYEFAADVIEAVSVAVDLPYGYQGRSDRSGRLAVLGRAQANLQKVRA